MPRGHWATCGTGKQKNKNVHFLALKIVQKKPKCEDDAKSHNETMPTIKIDNENCEACVESLVANVLWQMDQDRKARPLKQLQGHMWKHAYESGNICGQ
jgi:methionine salvage enolase-phosphatase E1